MDMLQDYLELVKISRFSLFILIGDFNINVLDHSNHSLCNMLDYPKL